MDPNFGWRGDLRCHLCKTTFPYMYCNIFHLQLCNAYVWEHILDDLQVKKKPHTIVPFKKRESIDKEHICQQLVFLRLHLLQKIKMVDLLQIKHS